MQSITLPQNPKFIRISDKSGKFEIDGCYPGYGATLGNALRRVLLSSLSGSAITSVKIKGVTHEFSTLPNVLEDVIQIVLNLKKVRFKNYNNEGGKVQLRIKGEKAINAEMIECPSGIEVVNGDAYIASITSPKGELEMEMEIGNGIGYVPVEQQEKNEKEIGVIAIDAIYTPMRRVNYTVDNMRVGKRTDFEKITLDIETDGSITPEEAFSRAVTILVDQFSIFLNINDVADNKDEKMDEKGEVDQKESGKSEIVSGEAVKKDDSQEIEVVNLKSLSTRTLNVLENNKIGKVKDIIKLTESQVGELEGMGSKGIKEIKKAIGEFGLNLKQGK